MTQIIDHKPETVKNGEATPEEVTAIVEEKTGLKLCKHCGVFKPVSEFSKCTSAPDGLQYTCKDCQREMRDAHKARLQKQRFTFAETNRKMLAVEKNPLAAYNNRDLLLELQRRGFKGELTITEVHRIDLTNFN